MLLRTLVLVLVIASIGSEAAAAIPPMSKEELEENADLIVEATVREVEKVGAERDDHCYTWQDFRAKLTVDKTQKGEASEAIHVRYKTIVKDVNDCVGGATSYAMTKGAQYELYLRKLKDGDYGFINWAGVNKIADEGPPPPEPATPEPEPEPAPAPSPSTPAVQVVPKAPAKKGGCACALRGQPSSPTALFSLLALFGIAALRRRCSPEPRS